MSSPTAPPPIGTRRELSLLSAARLRALASAHGLPSSGRKSALIDRLYRRRSQQARPSSPPSATDGSPSRSPSPERSSRSRSRSGNRRCSSSPSRLERTVERLVRHGLRGVEARILRAVQAGPQAPAHSPADNISLPSPPGPSRLAATERSTAAAATLVPPAALEPSTTAPPVQQPPIPDKIKQRILRGEYIEFDSLLPESLYPARYGASPSPAFILRLSNDTSADDGDVVIAQHKHVAKRSVSDLASWMEAWNLYVQILVAAYPQRAPALLAYQAIICGASSRFAPRLWLRYDQRFRASAAADSTLRWDVRNNELWLECFTQASLAPTAPANKPARRPCTYCGSLYHYPDNCPSHPFRARKRLTPPASKSV